MTKLMQGLVAVQAALTCDRVQYRCWQVHNNGPSPHLAAKASLAALIENKITGTDVLASNMIIRVETAILIAMCAQKKLSAYSPAARFIPPPACLHNLGWSIIQP